MRPDGPTSWLLDGRIGWRAGHEDGVVAAGRAGLQLAPLPSGPLSVREPGGTLGGLRSPGVLAVAGGDVYLLRRADPARVLRFDPARSRFSPLLALGGATRGTRALHKPVAIAATVDELFVADEEPPRVLVLGRHMLELRAVWGAGVVAPPIKLVAAKTGAYILDGARGRVWRLGPGSDRLELVVNRPDAAGRWDAVAVDRGRRVYLRDTDALDIFTAEGSPAGRVTDPAEVRDRFDPPPILVENERFCIPESLRRPCDRAEPVPPPRPEAALAGCADSASAIFDLSGRRVTVDPSAPRPAAWLREGTWVSDALDSEIAGCQWHRLDLDLKLPVGSSVEVATYADERSLSVRDVMAHAPDLWETRQVLTGAMQAGAVEPTAEELLVQSRPGRFLWLRLRLRGDGRATPAITSIRVQYPRESYLQYLPEIFSADDETRWFLERYLSIVQAEWDEIERRGREMPGLFDPDSVPAGGPLALLASWLGIPLEAAWSEDARRRVLAGAPAAAARRGTPEEVREWLRLTLAAIRGAEVDRYDYPQIVEGFRERAHLLLGTGAPAALGHGAPLWSRGVVGRMQLGVYSRAGEARLVSTGDPQRDLFHEYAHRFRVFVPAAWVRTAEEEQMVRRAIDGEKPAQTDYELCLVEPRLRVGVQSTVGFDTIVAAIPEIELADDPPTDRPESLPPRGRLGFDTVLGGPPRRGIQIGPDQRLGKSPPMT